MVDAARASGFTLGMFAGYVLMFRGVFGRAETREPIGLRESYQITMAGLAASRIFAAGGAGGLVLMAWALRRAGMRRREVADKTLSFLILTYFPYVLALIVCGLGLRLGIFPGPGPFGLTVVPAILASSRSGSACRSRSCRPTCSAASAGSSRAAAGWGGSPRSSRTCRPRRRRGCATRSTTSGPRPRAARRVRVLGVPDPRAVGGLQGVRRRAVVGRAVQAFFCGMLGNLLPMPGGVGGVEGGMIGALVAFNVDGGLAVVAVLVYRAFTFWLPLDPRRHRLLPAAGNEERGALHYTK